MQFGQVVSAAYHTCPYPPAHCSAQRYNSLLSREECGIPKNLMQRPGTFRLAMPSHRQCQEESGLKANAGHCSENALLLEAHMAEIICSASVCVPQRDAAGSRPEMHRLQSLLQCTLDWQLLSSLWLDMPNLQAHLGRQSMQSCCFIKQHGRTTPAYDSSGLPLQPDDLRHSA